MTWRVVNTNNFGEDYPDEKFVGPEYRVKQNAINLANALNAEMHELDARFHKVVEMPYKLQPGFQP